MPPQPEPIRANVYDSTVGITLYNLLQMHGRPYLADDLFRQAQLHQHRDLERPQFDRALAQLVTRGWISEAEDGYKSRDPVRRMVVDRDKGSAEANLGIVDGGWCGWKVRNQIGLSLLEDALKEGANQ